MLKPRVCGVILILISVLVLWYCTAHNCDATGGVFYALLGLCMLLIKDGDSDDKEWRE